ncbi:MAG: hypothetical protein SF066_11485 [Thermoanaerobaculia bacterium]|jgi:hypothetical protein|nr:hypothetical protein [Thermoanaerobaculia bacterium]
MEVPAEVLIHNELLAMKGGRGTLLAVSPHGFYEVNLRFGERLHRVLLPISGTIVISQVPEEALPADGFEIER